MSALKYAALVLQAWPQVRDVLRVAERAPAGSAAADAAVTTLLAIMNELDHVENDESLAKDALARVESLAQGFGNDPAIDALIDKRFPRG